jgi:hypothetical protein
MSVGHYNVATARALGRFASSARRVAEYLPAIAKDPLKCGESEKKLAGPPHLGDYLLIPARV